MEMTKHKISIEFGSILENRNTLNEKIPTLSPIARNSVKPFNSNPHTGERVRFAVAIMDLRKARNQNNGPKGLSIAVANMDQRDAHSS